MNLVYQFLLTLNATSWMIVVYAVKSKWQFFDLSPFASGVCMLLIPVFLSVVALGVARGLGTDSLHHCKEIELADNEFLPVYLGYFFVALSIPDLPTLVFAYAILFVFTWLSRTEYFNPLYLLFRYHYYHVRTEHGTRIFVIVRGPVMRHADEMSFDRLKRINDTTYLVRRDKCVRFDANDDAREGM